MNDIMKSGKQKRVEIKAIRKQQTVKVQSNSKQRELRLRPVLGPPVNETLLASYDSDTHTMRIQWLVFDLSNDALKRIEQES